MRVHLLHGFNVTDGGRGTIDRFGPYFAAEGFELVDHNYGWVGLLGLRSRNTTTVRKIRAAIRPGDIVVAHSNGCLIAWMLAMAGEPLAGVVCIQPALRKDTTWPAHINVLCLNNPDDWVVSLGRMWGRFASVANPWRNRHGWGAAGRSGFIASQSNVTNLNTAIGPYPATGHSGVFKSAPLNYWGPKVCEWAHGLATPMLKRNEKA